MAPSQLSHGRTLTLSSGCYGRSHTFFHGITLLLRSFLNVHSSQSPFFTTSLPFIPTDLSSDQLRSYDGPSATHHTVLPLSPTISCHHLLYIHIFIRKVGRYVPKTRRRCRHSQRHRSLGSNHSQSRSASAPLPAFTTSLILLRSPFVVVLGRCIAHVTTSGARVKH